MRHQLLILSCIMLLAFTGCTALKNDDITEDKKYGNLAEYYEEDMAEPEYDVVKAKVIRIDLDDTKEERPDIMIQQDIRYQHLYIQILEGDHKGEEYTVRNTVEMVNPYRLIFDVGDKMYIYLFETDEGKVGNIHIYERSRDGAILWLVIAYLGILVLVGGFKGFKAVVTLTFTVLMIGLVMLPLILNGFNPLLVTVGVVSVTTTFSLIVISGWNKKTRTAILGTIGGVLVAACVAGIVSQVAMLTGLGDDQAQMLAYIPQNRHLDFKGILLAGIIVGALGAVMDVALSVASAMWEIEEHSPKISTKQLIRSGMNVGKDIMGSMSNTLILAYVGGSIHLLLLFIAYNVSIAEILNMDMIASEIVRAVAGSIGLISAIPLTTWIGGTFGRKSKTKNK
ncbi:YibE/F family protein [Vallitalea okinawensis]|uniref:YibE/F family protein n=1 Tax=Vallitalea okinawensis TaxID=2078660 RepID=UPI001FA8B131|nr:YibE/F family protein [Vallitalea okinawensis]